MGHINQPSSFQAPNDLQNLRIGCCLVGLPKTRSGKIMRRVLRKIASKEEESLGDISTLADPGVVKDLIANRP